MRKFTLLSLVVSAGLSLMGQQGGEDFDGPLDGGGWFGIEIVNSEENIWQVGPPQKAIFDSAFTEPNVLITDTVNSYPANNESIFQIVDVRNEYYQYVNALRWMQKLDMEAGKDFGIVEISLDNMQTWQNVFDNPYIYNYYGFEAENLDTLDATGEIGFTGTDSTWRDIWLCFEGGEGLSDFDEIQFRWRFVSDSVDTQQEGWMIDDLYMRYTMLHTLANEPQEKFMKVFPTMTSDRVFIETRKDDGLRLIEDIQLVDINGRIVNSWGKAPTKFFIDVSPYPAGTYTLVVTTNIKTESFTIQIVR